jgi:glucose-1-phosphate thymidylyltransferase
MIDGQLRVKTFARGTTWLDMGTPSTLLEAAEYIRVVQDRQGLLIGSPEEAAWRAGWIDDAKLLELSFNFNATQYGELLAKLPEEGK